jgi:hypothetical protein
METQKQQHASTTAAVGSKVDPEQKTSTEESPHAKELVECVKKLHNEIKESYAKYKKATDDDTKSKLARELKEKIFECFGRSEAAFFPAIKEIPDLGKAAEEKVHKWHREVRENLNQLDNISLKTETQAHDRKLEKVLNDFTVHLEHTEEKILPAINKHCLKDVKDILSRWKKASESWTPQDKQ